MSMLGLQDRIVSLLPKPVAAEPGPDGTARLHRRMARPVHAGRVGDPQRAGSSAGYLREVRPMGGKPGRLSGWTRDSSAKPVRRDTLAWSIEITMTAACGQ
jgi:hypothetical protein